MLQNYLQINISDLRKNYKFISLVYLQNDCEPCYTKFIEWHNKMDSISYSDNYTVLFNLMRILLIISTKKNLLKVSFMWQWIQTLDSLIKMQIFPFGSSIIQY